MKSKKTLFICKRYYTNKDLVVDKFGRNYYIPIELAKEKYFCKVIAVDYKNKNKEHYSFGSVDFITIPSSIFKFLVSLLAIYAISKKFKPDIIVASGDSHIGFSGWLISKVLNSKFVFDVYDYYPSFGSNRLPLMKFMFKFSVWKSDLVTCASMELVKHLQAINKKIIFSPNGVDANIFYPRCRDAARLELELGLNNIIIGYFGSMEYMRGIDVLVEACNILRNRGAHINLLLAGRNSENLYLNSNWINYKGEVSQAEISKLICSCNVVVVPYRETSLIQFGNSCKTAEYIACRVPIVATRVKNFTENHREVLDVLSGALCHPGSASLLADAIEYQVKNQIVVDDSQLLYWADIAKHISKCLPC